MNNIQIRYMLAQVAKQKRECKLTYRGVPYVRRPVCCCNHCNV